MLTMTDLGYLLALDSDPLKDAPEDGAIEVYCEETDMIPLKAFMRLKDMGNRLEIIPYRDIGGGITCPSSAMRSQRMSPTIPCS